MLAAEEIQEALNLSSGWFLDNLWLVGLIPAIGFALIMGFGKKMPNGGSEFGLASMVASLVVATGAGLQWMNRVDSAEEAGHGGDEAIGLLQTFGRSVPRAAEGAEAAPFIEPVLTTWVWWQNSGLEFGIGSLGDGLAILLLWLVAFISLLVQIFSLDYVRDDRRYTQFFGALTLFSAGMLVMVMAPNMIQLILGWEIMGLCSFMLIGHWWEDHENSKAALKAFFTVRVGDVGLLVGTAIIYFASSDWIAVNLPGKSGFDIDAIQAWALSGDSSARGAAILVAATALFIACIGKSGQFPLHTWLPDAMAGPTPVSSLLHSSTMVVAGRVPRCPHLPGLLGRLQHRQRRVELHRDDRGDHHRDRRAPGVRARRHQESVGLLDSEPARLHDVGARHRRLAAGCVPHLHPRLLQVLPLSCAPAQSDHSGSHHSFDMKKDMGGLRKHMPITFWSWIVSTLALTGVIPFRGLLVEGRDHRQRR